MQVNRASKTWNLLEPRAWKAVLPSHMLLQRELWVDLQGQSQARLKPTALAWDRQCGNHHGFFSPKESSSITESLMQHVNKTSYRTES